MLGRREFPNMIFITISFSCIIILFRLIAPQPRLEEIESKRIFVEPSI